MSKIPYDTLTSNNLHEYTLEHLRAAYEHFCGFPSTSTWFRFKDEVAREIRDRALPVSRASIMLPLPLIEALREELHERFAGLARDRGRAACIALDVFEETLARLDMKVVPK